MGYLTSYLDTITVSKVVNILIAAVLLLLALLYLLLVLYPQYKEADLLPRTARNRPAGTSAKGDDGSICEGVIAIDNERRIEVINQAARKLLGLSQPARELRGQLISQVIDPVPFFDTQTMLAKDTTMRFAVLTISR